MRLCCRIASRLAPAVAGLALVVNGVHTLVHGTPLDGGALDGLLVNLNMFAAYFTSLGAE